MYISTPWSKSFFTHKSRILKIRILKLRRDLSQWVYSQLEVQTHYFQLHNSFTLHPTSVILLKLSLIKGTLTAYHRNFYFLIFTFKLYCQIPLNIPIALIKRSHKHVGRGILRNKYRKGLLQQLVTWRAFQEHTLI